MTDFVDIIRVLPGPHLWTIGTTSGNVVLLSSAAPKAADPSTRRRVGRAVAAPVRHENYDAETNLRDVLRRGAA